MKYILPALLFLIAWPHGIYPQAKIDSLKQLLDTKLPDTARVNTLVRLGVSLVRPEPFTSRKYGQEAIALSQKIDYAKGLAGGWRVVAYTYERNSMYDSAITFYERSIDAWQAANEPKELAATLNFIANNYARLDQFNQAKKFLQKSLDIAIPIHDTVRIGGLYNTLGIISKNQGQYDSSIYHYRHGLKLLEGAGGKPNRTVALLYMNLGGVYEDLGAFEKALEYQLISLGMREKLNDETGLADMLLNIGTTYSSLGDAEKALDYYGKALQVSKRIKHDRVMGLAYNNISNYYAKKNVNDSTKLYANRAFNVFKRVNDQRNLSLIMNNIGVFHRNQQNYDSAIHYLSQSREIRERANDQYQLVYTYTNLGSTYSRMGDSKALGLLESALDIAEDLKSQNIVEPYKAIEEHYLSNGNFEKAYEFQNKRIAYDDSVRSREVERRVSSLEKSFEIQKKEDELAILERDNQLKQQLISQAERDKMFYLIIALVTLILGAGLFYLQRKKHQVALFLAENEKIIFDQKIQRLLKESEITRIEALLKGQEEERRRMARDLHDGLGGMLAALKISLQGDKKDESNNRALMLAEKSAEEVRKISHNLMAGALKKYGLVEALKGLGWQVTESTGLKLNFFFDQKEYPLGSEAETHLFRMLQEIISNCIKHARARELSIQFHSEGELLHITTEDDGVGFDKSEVVAGIGLGNIRDRAEALHAILSTESSAGNGCTYFIEVPLAINQPL